MIESIRTLLDLEKIMELTKEMSTALVAQRHKDKFIEAARNIDEDFDHKYEITEMRYQVSNFIEVISDIGNEVNSDKLSSLDIMVKLMSSKEERWKGCEGVMDILCQAATKKSVEAVVESWVSVLEHHSNKSRNLKSESIQNEMMVAVNGPLVQHSTTVVEEAMVLYWKEMKRETLQAGHFTRRSENVKSFTVSKTVDSLNAISVKTTFMI